MSYKVKTIPKFEKELKRLAKKYHSLKNEYLLLIQSLQQQPEQGTPLGNEPRTEIIVLKNYEPKVEILA